MPAPPAAVEGAVGLLLPVAGPASPCLALLPPQASPVRAQEPARALLASSPPCSASLVLERLLRPLRSLAAPSQLRVGGGDGRAPDVQAEEVAGPWPSDEVDRPKLFLSIPVLRKYADADAAVDARARAARGREEEQEARSMLAARLPSPHLCSPPPTPASPLQGLPSLYRLLVSVQQVAMAAGSFEPFFLSMAVWDASSKEQVSEVWEVQANEAVALSLLAGHAQASAANSARRCLVHLPTCSCDLVLLVLVSKVLRGVELDAATDPYMKGSLKPKEKEKLLKECGQTFPRLAPYRQPFAWGGLQLFSETGKLVAGSSSQVRLTRARADDAVPAMLEALRRGKGDKKNLPADLLLDVALLQPGEAVPGTLLTPALHRDGGGGGDGGGDGQDLVRELQSFSEAMEPQLDVVHHLYVGVEGASLAKHKDAAKANVAVEVRLRADDQQAEAEGELALYGDCLQADLVGSRLTRVAYRRRAPTFLAQAKVRLPLHVSARHHLLLDVVHVACDKAAKPAGETRQPLAFAVLPLLADGRFRPDGLAQLPLALARTPAYLGQEFDQAAKWVDNKKPLLAVRTRLVSSLVAQDPHVAAFLAAVHAGAGLGQACAQLRSADRVVLGRSFPLLLGLLLDVPALHPDAAPEALSSLLAVCAAVGSFSGQSGKSPMLLAYAHHHYDLPGPSPTPAFESLVAAWCRLLQSKQPEVARSLEYAWFLLRVIAKALVLHLADNGLLDLEDRSKTVTASQAEGLKQLVGLLASSMAFAHAPGQQERVCEDVGHFLFTLLSAINRDVALDLAHLFCSSLPRTPALAAPRLAFLAVLAAHPHYLHVNLPGGDSIATVAGVQAEFWGRHFLVGLLVDELRLACPQTVARAGLVRLLRSVVAGHERDPALATPEARRAVADMYFPVVLLAIEQAEAPLEAEEQRDWTAVLLYVLANCHEQLLAAYWAADTQKNHLVFASLLARAVGAFEEAGLVQEASFVVLDVLERFMAAFAEELASEGSKLMEAVFAVLQALLQARQTVTLLSCLFMSLRRLVWRFPEVLFAHHNTSYCSLLCYELLRYTNAANAVPRSEAGSLFYLMIKTNHALRGNFSRMKMQSTIAVSRLCGEAATRDFSCLQKTLEYAALLSKREFQGQALGSEVEELTKRLFKVIHDSAKISEYAFDPETTADLTYDVSVGYVDSPDLRLAWLENLARLHRDQKNLEEVAQCKFAVAGLVVGCLNLQGPLLGLPRAPDELASVCPNIALEPGVPSLAATGDERLFNSAIFSEAGLVETLTAAVKFLKMGERYETCIDVYNTLLEIYQSHRDYQKLASSFRDLKSVCDVLVASNQAHSRIFNIYYRVVFFGARFGHLDGKEVVYKEANFVRLADFSQRLVTQFTQADGTAPKILTKSVVDASTLDGGEMHLQIVAVEPYFEEGESANRSTEWDRNFNIRHFIFETPFTTTGKAHGDLSVQCKRKTILEMERAFPYVRKRIAVCGHREIILQPIENAIEIITNRKNALRNELELNPPNLKTLQINLQGAVLAQVNSGPTEIARTFLGANASAFPPAHVAKLVAAVQEFKNVCGFALKLNKKLIGADQLDFQTECEKGFAAFSQDVARLVQQTPNVAAEG